MMNNQNHSDNNKHLTVAITGATGVIYAIRLLEILAENNIKTNLIISPAAALTIKTETDYSLSQVKKLASKYYDFKDIGADISSGSKSLDLYGMVILPCSIKTLSAVSNSFNDNLISRAADVCLKESLPLVLAVRETPLHLGHLRLMTQAAEIGAKIMPPIPAFYHNPQSIDQLILQSLNRILDQFKIKLPQDLFTRWNGTK